jgi:hypothetical protein
MANKVWHFDVVGSGYFPYDMLRYDRCWPAKESEAPKLNGRMKVNDRIEMTGYSEPTVGRWQSFGWTVINVRKGF